MTNYQNETSSSTARRSESLFASAALGLLLALMLFYGCRAFDPEPVIVNRPPDTFITGAPAETTGSRFLRHLYWYGVDRDGEVVRFIYAITDSTVRDVEEQDVDEEDDRFNPAEDITTTLNEPGRRVGFTTRTDSVFTFTIDRGATTAKDVTFHIVAVDDRGAIDPTPARLYFFANSLGNPVVRFTVETEENDGSGPTWRERWVGTVNGPDPSSPEQTPQPFVGFSRKFRVSWLASSPNGGITGYRAKVSQDAAVGLSPPDINGVHQWDPDLTSHVYNNDRPPDAFPLCDLNLDTGQFLSGANCPMDEIRLPSDSYQLLVVALDAALVESAAVDGELVFNVNYPPETDIVVGGGWPQAVFPDGAGGSLNTISENDTIPVGSYVTFQYTGFDRVGDTPSDFCCDQRLDLAVPEVRFQGQNLMTADEGGGRLVRIDTIFSETSAEDTLGFTTGPFEYRHVARSVDEHGRQDAVADTFAFVSGYRPYIRDVFPSAQDSLILRAPGTSPWPENDIVYTIESQTLYWDGLSYHENQDNPDWQSVPGNWYRFHMRFEGAPHMMEPLTEVAAWSFSNTSEFDPFNVNQDGLESRDLAFFENSTSANVWDFAASASPIEVFVPNLIWSQPDFFDPDSPVQIFRETGNYLREFMGRIQLRVLGRTTTAASSYDLYQRVRECVGCGEPVAISVEKSGRRTDRVELNYHIYLGLDTASTGEIQRLWPD